MMVAKDGARATGADQARFIGKWLYLARRWLRTTLVSRYNSPHDVPFTLPTGPLRHFHLDLRRLAGPGLQAAVHQEHVHQGVSERGRG